MGKLNLNEWRRIGAPDHILDWIEYGVKIPFKETPIPCMLDNRISGAKQWNFVDSELKKLLKEGFIRESETKPHCVLPIQTVPQK